MEDGEKMLVRLVCFCAALPLAAAIIVGVHWLVSRIEILDPSPKVIFGLEVAVVIFFLAAVARKELIETLHFLLSGELHGDVKDGLHLARQLLIMVGGSLAIYAVVVRFINDRTGA